MSERISVTKKVEKNILLVLLPFWAPLIPPLGIATLKSYLSSCGYQIKTIDANTESYFEEFAKKYLHELAGVIPESKQFRIHQAGFEVLRYHLLAHMHSQCDNQYLELVDTLIYNSFYYAVDRRCILNLKHTLDDFFQQLDNYIIGILESEKPDVLGISVYNDTLAASLYTFKRAKELSPHIMTVMGGGIFAGDLSLDSPNYETFLAKTPYIDKIIAGEGEELFLDLFEE